MPSSIDVYGPAVWIKRCTLAALVAIAGCNSPMPQPLAPVSVSTPIPVAATLEAAASAAGAARDAALSQSVAGAAAAAAASSADSAIRFEAAAGRLLAYVERVRELGPADLAREQVRLADAGDEPVSRLQLALLLAYSRQNGDLPRAQGVLEPLTRQGVAPPWRGLARLLQDRLAEQRRLEEQADRQAQQMREQQRRIEQLNNQLEALKAIERSISGRPPGAALPPAPGAPGAARPQR
ncbi:MAG: hypothetical protein M3Y32_10250 [Pseudomonadota bacterium]|nr:hypothetical protein [Pseudomonadota bacterium]